LETSTSREEQRKRDEEQRKRDEKRDEEQGKRDEELRKLLEADKTEKRSMSKANKEFSTSLLQGLGISWARTPGNKDAGTQLQFSWDGGEEVCTPKAVTKLKDELCLDNIQGDTRSVEVVDVHKVPLCPLRACGKEAPGQTDIAIRFQDLQHDDQAALAFVIGMVELKTTMYQLNFFQQLLELVAMSRMSNYGQSVVLLGTDLNTKWEVLCFDTPNHVVCQQFSFGSVALAFFKEKLLSVHSRKQALQPLASIADGHQSSLALDAEQDLSEFGIALDTYSDRVHSVQEFARHLTSCFGAKVTIPACVQRPDLSGMYS